MDVEIVSEEENPMLHRSDITFELTHNEATPARLQIRDSLAAKLNKEADEVVIRKIDTKFGMRKSVGHAKVYETGDLAASIEQDHMLERNKIEDEEAESAAEEAEEAEAEPAEEADEEEPAEEAEEPDEPEEEEEAAETEADEEEDE